MKNWVCILFWVWFPLCVYAQAPDDSLKVETPTDTVTRAVNKWRWSKRKRDLVNEAKLQRSYAVTDSIMYATWLKQPRRYYRPLYLDSIERSVLQKKFDPEAFKRKYGAGAPVKNELPRGKPLPKSNWWIPAAAFILLAAFGALRLALGRQMDVLVLAFFNNRQLANLLKDDTIFTSRWFLVFFIHIGLCIGLVMYLLAQYSDLTFEQDGFKTFMYVSGLVVILYTAKLALLRLLGYLFEITKPVGEYITLLYLCYYAVGMAFIPMMIILAIAPLWYNALIYKLAVIVVLAIFSTQLLRAGIRILTAYKFPKFYLLLYFCALEICPVFIVVKAIGF